MNNADDDDIEWEEDEIGDENALHEEDEDLFGDEDSPGIANSDGEEEEGLDLVIEGDQMAINKVVEEKKKRKSLICRPTLQEYKIANKVLYIYIYIHMHDITFTFVEVLFYSLLFTNFSSHLISFLFISFAWPYRICTCRDIQMICTHLSSTHKQ